MALISHLPSRSIAWAALAAIPTAAVLAMDPRARMLAFNTALLASAVSTVSLVVGAPLAFIVSRTDAPGRRLACVVLLTLLFLPLYLQAAAWQAAFGVGGWFTASTAGAALLDSWRGAVGVHVLAAIPWVVVITSVGLRLVEPELEEGALLDATPGGVFRRVTLRRAADAALTAALWVAVTTAGEMTVTDLFQVRTYAEELYTDFALGDEPRGASWRTLPGVVIVGWMMAGGLLAIGRLIAADRHATVRPSHLFRLGRWRWLLGGLLLVIVGLLSVLPTTSLIIKAGRLVTHDASGLTRTWSAAHCWTVLSQSPLRFRAEFGWSAAIAGLAALTAVALGVPLAWMARAGGVRALGMWFLIAATLALPGPLVGLGLIAMFNTPGWAWLGWTYDQTIAAPWLAASVRALPLGTLVLWYGLRTIPADELASATLEGARPITRMMRIVLPQRWPVVAAAGLVAFATAWGELSTSILVVPPGVTTLPIQIFGLIHYGVDDRLAGVSLAVMASVALIAAALMTLICLTRHGHD